jgi:protein-S-isoprenylcysteine O-methyltransferase Ste14
MEPTFQDYLYIGGIFALGALLIVALVSFALHYVVALSSPPAERARWTAGIAYIVAALIVTLPAFEPDPTVEMLGWFGPLIALPAGLIAYWFWRADFQRDWMDDSQPISDDVEVANDDWRVGLIFVVGVIVILTIKALIRLSLH